MPTVSNPIRQARAAAKAAGKPLYSAAGIATVRHLFTPYLTRGFATSNG